MTSKLGQLPTCLNLMTTRHNSCLSLLEELSNSIDYLLQSLEEMFKFPSISLYIRLSYYYECTCHQYCSDMLFELRRLSSIRRFLTSIATATLVSAFALSRIDYCNLLLLGSTHDVKSHLQRMQNNTARVILRLPKSSSITTHLKSLHLLPAKVRSTYKIACLCYHCHSNTAPPYAGEEECRRSYHTPATYAPGHAPCPFSIDLYTVRRHLVIARFLLLLLLSGTQFQMMSGVPHHCHHLSVV